MSPVKANVMLVGLLVAAVVGIDDVVPEVVELQPVVMQANTKSN